MGWFTTAKILEWFTIASSSGPCFVRTLHHLGWPCTAWLLASLSYTSPFALTRQWSGIQGSLEGILGRTILVVSLESLFFDNLIQPMLLPAYSWNCIRLCIKFSEHTIFLVVLKFSFFFLILFFNFTILYWFCHISTWIRHRHTRVPHPEPSSLKSAYIYRILDFVQTEFPVFKASTYIGFLKNI